MITADSCPIGSLVGILPIRRQNNPNDSHWIMGGFILKEWRNNNTMAVLQDYWTINNSQFIRFSEHLAEEVFKLT